MGSRDLSTHAAIAVSLLYKATVATTTFDNPEIQSFRDGLLLPCRNGFNLRDVSVALQMAEKLLIALQAIRNFEGGSEAFLSLIATSYISSADSLIPHIEFTAPPALNMYLASLRSHTGDITLTFTMLVERFLRGIGIPCPLRFEGTKGSYHPMVTLALSRIDSPGFRSQALAWAATGSPLIDPTGGKIYVSQYLPSLLISLTRFTARSYRHP